MTEKETLLCMIKNSRKGIPISHVCRGIDCFICFYFENRNICDCIIAFNNEIPEELYIEKFGYVSLIEELL